MSRPVHMVLSLVTVSLVSSSLLAGGKSVTFKKPTPPPAPAAASGTTATPPAPAATFPAGSAYWLGVRISPADETLRRQLKLGEKGLVVRDVIVGTPARVAGVAPHDVLLEAVIKETVTPLQQIVDLSRAVNSVGADEAPVQLKLLREGEPLTLEIVPAKRVVATRQ